MAYYQFEKDHATYNLIVPDYRKYVIISYALLARDCTHSPKLHRAITGRGIGMKEVPLYLLSFRRCCFKVKKLHRVALMSKQRL